MKPRVAMTAQHRFRVASVTKTFTAALVLRLVADDVLSLDDTVERWLPGRLPNGAGTAITVRHLLGHTSGLVNAGSEIGPVSVVGPPGRFYYANGNYELLGAIVAAATGSTYEQQLTERILVPLKLARTELTTLVPGGLAHGYSPAKPRLDFTAASFPIPPAGGLVSDATDLARFERALFGGSVLPAALVRAMQTPGSLDGYDAGGYDAYGLGLMRFRAPCGVAWGHRGKIPGYIAWMLSTADGRRTVVALLNVGELTKAVLVARGLNKLVLQALCV